MQLSYEGLMEGMSTAEVLTLLVSQNEFVGALFAFNYRHPPLLQSRISLTHDEQTIFAKAIGMRSALSLPFWEALMLSCFDTKGDYERILKEAAFHQSHQTDAQRLSREVILAGGLSRLAATQPKGHNVSFSSSVECTAGDRQHLLLLDFHCSESTENDRLVAAVCKQLFLSPSLLFSSGESYHALGTLITHKAALRTFLARSILYSPIVDSRYVAHQLLEGACALRLNSSGEKPIGPRLKAVITPKSDC